MGRTGDSVVKVKAAYAGDLGSISSTQMVAHNYLSLQFQRIQLLLLIPTGALQHLPKLFYY